MTIRITPNIKYGFSLLSLNKFICFNPNPSRKILKEMYPTFPPKILIFKN